MQEPIIIALFFLVFAFIILIPIIRSIVMHLKAYIQIFPDKENYFFGDTCKVRFLLKARKNLEMQLIDACLVSYRKEKEYNHQNIVLAGTIARKHSTRTVTRELYKEVKELSKFENIFAGSEKEFTTEFYIPKLSELPNEMNFMVESNDYYLGKSQKFYRGQM